VEQRVSWAMYTYPYLVTVMGTVVMKGVVGAVAVI
jgi:hypothetical protein